MSIRLLPDTEVTLHCGMLPQFTAVLSCWVYSGTASTVPVPEAIEAIPANLSASSATATSPTLLDTKFIYHTTT